jgi:hypothetical protein
VIAWDPLPVDKSTVAVDDDSHAAHRRKIIRRLKTKTKTNEKKKSNSRLAPQQRDNDAKNDVSRTR